MSQKRPRKDPQTDPITDDELRGDFRSVVAQLRELTRSYERGRIDIAPAIAVVLRNFLYKSRTSTPLLEHVDRLKTPFISTRFATPPIVNLRHFFPLCTLRGPAMVLGEEPSEPRGFEYVPRYWIPVGQPSSLHSPDEYEIQWLEKSFANWWNDPVLFDGTGRPFCRREIVGYLANAGAGAHTDRERDVAHLRLARGETSLTVKLMQAGKLWALTQSGPHAAYIRQISYELQLTLDRYCADLLDEPATVPPHILRKEATDGPARPMYDMNYMRRVLTDLEQHGFSNTNTAAQLRARLYWEDLAREQW